MEAVVRRAPVHVRDLEELPELRRWQLEVLGEDFVRVLSQGSSPYRDA
jgi:ribonuclease D